MRPVLLLLILCSLGALSGCAAICKGPSSAVRLNVPTPIEFHNYSGYEARIHLDGQHELEVTSGQEYVVEYQRGEYRDSMLLERKLLWSYLAMDLYATLMIGFAVDLAGPGYTIDKDFIAFPPPPDSLLDTTATPRLNLYAYDGHSASVHRPLGLVATASMGTSLLYGDAGSYGGGIGYHVSAPFVVMGYCGDNVLTDHVPKGSPISMDASITAFALEARYHIALESPDYLVRGIYATGGLEYLFIAADSLSLASDTGWQRVGGFSDRIPALSLGAGMAFQGFFVEVRQHWGLESLHIREGMLEPLSYFTIRWGVNVEI